ncbi:orotidine-5'-phosphate decarboxylase [Hydrogenoanaerobacterium sp.]|uniref:orotidine-5'-phosphate decarboxylase n=1 Tax=Hydrogenoanaerobacterium sp. TaxID=2953763 RepID=UPI0028991987|nr:orotidine-5'-phosphate decarboxylase [Hydrogenoanaerobacterium sp.]
MSFDKLISRIVETQNPTVAGLDPKLEYIPSYIVQKNFEEYGCNLRGASRAILEYNEALIDALCDIVPAVKPQCAYYEAFGYHGMKALYKTIEYAKSKGMYVITDGKRNDIGSTMEAYAIAHLGTTQVGDDRIEAFGGDALTVNGYLGTDGIAPLIDICKERDKGVFVLCKTSNKSSGELQDRLIDGKPVYRIMGEMCEKWGESAMGELGYSAVGAVVGATYPEQLAELRAAMPHTFFLVPGYGAQGGGAKDVIGAFDAKGLGAIVNSSRGILCAWQKEGCDEHDFAQAARREALRMKQDITQHLTGGIHL